MKKIILLGSLTFFLVLMISCEKMLPPAPADEEILAGTIPGLSSQQEIEHLIGDAAFGEIFSPAQGLGPIFVQTSCANCHVGNGKGHPSTMVNRFAKIENGQVDYLLDHGGPQLQERSIPGYAPEAFPSQANVFTKRLAPAVMGLGYIAALSDASILANADSSDVDGDGISGRVNYVTPTDFFTPQTIHTVNNGKYIGRFGKKAEKVTIQDQVVFALKQDIGITSDFDTEDLYNAQSGINTGDHVPDPEVSSSFVHSLVFYMRTLKAPPRRNINDADVVAGQNLFEEIGCTSCHKSTFITTESDISALSNQTFHPYSDFLLHDMGELLDDSYPEGSANSNEWRTPPLWGIGLAKDSQGGNMFLLHDGRATTFEGVISYHGGEASGRRAAFYALTEQQKGQIIKFLESL
ncbi:MAG: di-heme oxidoredictase family protein [Bacteroidota bacterium]|nr:di-heme oxidoredictase family protein [Bacteroidota bacterium]